jgi:AmiR/NasT family two-component response regulator
MTTADHDLQMAQAAGMVSVQAGRSTHEALRLIRRYARSTARTVEDVAESIVDRDVRIEAHSQPT